VPDLCEPATVVRGGTTGACSFRGPLRTAPAPVSGSGQRRPDV